MSKRSLFQTGVLIRLSLRQLLGQLSGNFSRGGRYSALLAGLLFLMLAALSALTSASLAFSVPDSARFLVVLSMTLTAFCLMLVFGFYHAQGYLFDFRDFDLLFSMPLTQRQILVSKLVARLGMMLLYSGILIAPMTVVFGRVYSAGAELYLIATAGMLMLPLVPLVIGTLIALGIRWLSAGRQHAVLWRNIVSLLMIMLLMIGMLMFSWTGKEGQDLSGMLVVTQRLFPTVSWLTRAMLHSDWLALGKLAGVSLVSLGGFLLLCPSLWAGLNQRSRRDWTQAAKQEVAACRPLAHALFHKEVRRYFASTSLVTNTLVGPLMIVVSGIGLLVERRQLILIAQMLPSAPSSALIAALLTLAVSLFCITLMPMSATTISLEGRCFWIVRSLPLRAEELFRAKLRLNFLLNAPLAWLCTLVLAAVFRFPLFYLGMSLLLQAAAAMAAGLWGLIINLHFPRFDYDREVVVVKQSLSALISVLVGMGYSFLACAGVLSGIVPLPLALLAVLAMTGIADLLMMRYLHRHGEALLRRL